MKATFAMSLVSALLSLLAVLGLSAMTIVPGAGAESFRATTMIVVGVFFVAWLSVAFWARPRQRTESGAIIPRWLSRLLVVVSAVYSFLIILFVLG
jgi:hypothetical protein